MLLQLEMQTCTSHEPLFTSHINILLSRKPRSAMLQRCAEQHFVLSTSGASHDPRQKTRFFNDERKSRGTIHQLESILIDDAQQDTTIDGCCCLYRDSTHLTSHRLSICRIPFDAHECATICTNHCLRLSMLTRAIAAIAAMPRYRFLR